jgi:hypothetical protein
MTHLLVQRSAQIRSQNLFFRRKTVYVLRRGRRGSFELANGIATKSGAIYIRVTEGMQDTAATALEETFS